MYKNRKTIMLLVTLLLSAGFVAVGAIGTTSMEDRTADNSKQAANAFGSYHDAMRSVVVESPRKNDKNKKRKRQKQDDSRSPNSSSWDDDAKGKPVRGSRRWYQCQRSKGLKEWQKTMKFHPKHNRNPGTKHQKEAHKRLRLQTPFALAKNLAEDLKADVLNGHATVQDVLNREALHILQSETRRIKDPAVRLDYLLHVVNNYGHAYGQVITEEEDRRKLTLRVSHINNMLAFIHNDGTLYNGFSNLTLEVRPYTIAKNTPGITPVVYSLHYKQKSSPFYKVLKKQVDAELDDYIKEHSSDAEQIQLTATLRLQEWTNLYTQIETGERQVQDLQQIPDEFAPLVSQYRTSGNLMKRLQASGAEEAAMEEFEQVTKLQNEFVSKYTALLQSKEKSRSEHRNILLSAKETEALSEVHESRHSWEIRMLRKKGDVTEVTLQWHLSHMSEYRERNKKVEKNTHTGARFLMGPSNGVRMPNDVSRHYVNGAKNFKDGFQRYTGDAASLQFIKFGNNSPNQFDIANGLNYEQGMKITRRRNDRKSMLTLINVVLGNCPYNDGWRLAGLYSDPELVESNGQMTAKVISSFTKKTRRQSNTGKQRNKNQRKNRRAAKALAQKNAEDIPTLEEVMEDPDTQKTLEEMRKQPKEVKEDRNFKNSWDKAHASGQELHSLRDTLLTWSNDQLKLELKKNGQKGYSRLNKGQLVNRVIQLRGLGHVKLEEETLEALNELEQANNPNKRTTAKKPRTQKKKKARKLPDASRRGRDKKSDV